MVIDDHLTVVGPTNGNAERFIGTMARVCKQAVMQRCRQALQDRLADKWEHYALEHLGAHLLQHLMRWAARYDEAEVIECALNRVDLHQQQRNSAPHVVELVAQSHVDGLDDAAVSDSSKSVSDWFTIVRCRGEAGW